MDDLVYEMGAFLFKVKYTKTSTTNVFIETTDYECYDDTDKIEKMQHMAIANYIKSQSSVIECNGTVYTFLNQDKSNSQAPYILDLKLNESYTYESTTTNGFIATSTIKLIKENTSFKTAGKTFTLNVYE